MLAIDIDRNIIIKRQAELHKKLFNLCDFVDTEFKDRLRFVFKADQRNLFDIATADLKNKEIVFSVIDYN